LNDFFAYFQSYKSQLFRSLIQPFFFPYAYRNLEVTKLPKKGNTRVFTNFNVHVELAGETTWRLPTREQSKVRCLVSSVNLT
jgi:hypothetical protein